MPKSHKVQLWFAEARDDLIAAQAMLELKKTLPKISAFHSQQCVEKAIKGFLNFNKKRITKTHNLMALSHKVMEIDPSLKELLTNCSLLNDYAVSVRYPDAATRINVSDFMAEEAVQLAKKILEALSQKVN